MAIDTLKVARRLREAGFSEPQADALVAAVQEGAEGADLATKADLAVFGNELSRMMTMILTAVLVNVVTVPGAMFAAVRLLAH
jgi:hypothetical protein